MITVLHAPEEIMMTGNPIAYKVQTDNADCVFIALKVWVETAFMSGVYENIIVKTSEPDKDLQTTFYIDRRLEACLSDFKPNFTNPSLQKATQLVKRYYVELAELGAIDGIDTVDYTPQAVRYAMKAQFHRQAFPVRTGLLPYGNALFKNLKRKLDKTQKDFLSFCPPADVANFQLTLNISYTDNTSHNQVLSFGSVQKYEPVFIPIGLAERAYNSYHPTKTIKHINITTPYNVVNLTFFEKNNTATEIHYYTLAGGLESFLFKAERAEELEVNHEQFQHYVPYNYTQLDQEFKNYEKNVRKSGVVNTGILDCPTESHILDCLQSSVLYIRQKNGEYYPANNTTDKILGENTYQRVANYDLSFEYAYYE